MIAARTSGAARVCKAAEVVEGLWERKSLCFCIHHEFRLSKPASVADPGNRRTDGIFPRTTQTLYTTTTPSDQADLTQNLVTTTSNGVVYVIVESGSSDNNGQVQVVNNGAASVTGNGGLGGLVGIAVVGVLAVVVGGGAIVL